MTDELNEFIEGQSIENVRVDADREIFKLRAELRDLKSKNKHLLRLIEMEEKRVDAALSLVDSISEPTPIFARYTSSTREATAFALASDWHVEEDVRPETINFLNEYNTTIAKASAETYFQKVLRNLERARGPNGYTIENLVLWLGGDMITGYIHEELEESNNLSPTEALLFCKSLLVAGINLLLQEGRLNKITVVCNYGNHGRTTKKRRHNTAAKNSFEWMMYHTMQQHFRDEERIEFVIADGSHIYLDVYDWTIRFHHGDDVRYYGGVSGISLSLRKAHDAWNESRHADHTVIGHWHQLVNFNFALVNGSLIGYNAFAQSIKARYEDPKQGFFLMCKEDGLDAGWYPMVIRKPRITPHD